MKTVLERTRLPEGFRDFGPAAAQTITNTGTRLDRLYSSWGYRRVLTPTVEAEEVIGPALGPLAAAGAFRMVDPLTGQSLLYRPDITPQVARLVATGAAGAELPIKLFYRGAIVRRRAVGGHGAREIYQSGTESYGAEPAAADAETVALALEVASEAGLQGAVLELGDVRFVEGILAELGLDPEERALLTAAIDRKARAEIEAFLARHRVPRGIRKLLETLPDLFGDEGVLGRARALELPELSARAVASLEGLLRTLDGAGARPDGLSLDLAEIRGLDYYTGLLLALFVPGAAQTVLRGGRYDGLAGRFGRTLPAVGFATDIELLARLGKSAPESKDDLAPPDVVLFDPAGNVGRALAKAQRLRRGGTRVFVFATSGASGEQAARAFARRRGISRVVGAGPAGAGGTKKVSGKKPRKKKTRKKKAPPRARVPARRAPKRRSSKTAAKKRKR